MSTSSEAVLARRHEEIAEERRMRANDRAGLSARRAHDASIAAVGLRAVGLRRDCR